MEKADRRDLEAVIAGCKRGNSESFSRLIDAYGARLYGFFYRLSNDKTTSEDLLSELFVKLVAKIKAYRGGAFDSWLFRIASNVFNDWLRSKQRQIIRIRHAGNAETVIRSHCRDPDGISLAAAEIAGI